MKRTLLAFLFVAPVFSVTAQKMEIKALGSYKSTWLFNKSISDRGDDMDYSPRWGWNYGIGYAFYINDRIGFEINTLMANLTGGFSGTIDSAGVTKTYESYAQLSSLDLPILFKLRSETGAFLEAGIQYSRITGATFYHDGYTNTTLTVNESDVTDKFASTNLSALLGFGIRIGFGKHLGMMTGFRFEYGLSDLIGVDGLGIPVNNPVFYKEINGTSSAAGGLFLGFIIGLGGDSDDATQTPSTN